MPETSTALTFWNLQISEGVERIVKVGLPERLGPLVLREKQRGPIARGIDLPNRHRHLFDVFAFEVIHVEVRTGRIGGIVGMMGSKRLRGCAMRGGAVGVWYRPCLADRSRIGNKGQIGLGRLAQTL
jgi:hypothetical protein